MKFICEITGEEFFHPNEISIVNLNGDLVTSPDSSLVAKVLYTGDYCTFISNGSISDLYKLVHSKFPEKSPYACIEICKIIYHNSNYDSDFIDDYLYELIGNPGKFDTVVNSMQLLSNF